jgi:hypothetical protein
MFIAALTYILMRIYFNAKIDESVVHEWIDFPQLATIKRVHADNDDRHATLHVNKCRQMPIDFVYYYISFSDMRRSHLR